METFFTVGEGVAEGRGERLGEGVTVCETTVLVGVGVDVEGCLLLPAKGKARMPNITSAANNDPLSEDDLRLVLNSLRLL